MISAERRKQFRAIGHNLKPVVTIGGNGVSESVLAELERALDDHELIKVKIAAGEREDRADIIDSLCQHTRSELVQSIGKTALLYRGAAKPNPKLSNLLR